MKKMLECEEQRAQLNFWQGKQSQNFKLDKQAS
jgi:hypothetical protein